MQDPLRCHRSILMGRELEKEGFSVTHILDDYSTITQDKIESKLLDKYFDDRNQISFDVMLGNEKSEEDLLKEAYKLANKEIGYRIEKLN